MFDALAINLDGYLAPPGDACESPAAAVTPREDQRLFAEIALAALGMGMVDRARVIFEALAQLRPENAIGDIGLGLINLIEGRDAAAISALRRAGTAEQCSREAKAVLCVVLGHLGRASEARPIRNEIMRGPDCGARRMIAATGGFGR